MHPRWQRVVAVLLVLGLCAVGNQSGWASLVMSRSLPPWWTRDLDSGLIHSGVLRAPHFFDTYRWFVGPWAGVVPFYRPLSSLVFWADWKLWGNADWLYYFPMLAGHGVVCVLLSLFSVRLAARYGIATEGGVFLLTAWCFLGLGDVARLSIVQDTLANWKNQPDVFAAAFGLGSLLFYLRVQEGCRRAFTGCVACYLLACGFKEIAIPLPALYCLLEFGRPPRPERRRQLFTIFGAAAGFLVVRTLALRGVGFRDGSNHAWVGRTLLDLLGPFRMLVGGRWLECALGLAAFLGLILVYYRPPRTQGGRLALAAACLVVADILGTISIAKVGWGISLPAGLLAVTDPEVMWLAGHVVIFLASAYALARRAPVLLYFALGWTVLLLAPLAAAPGTLHRGYLPGAGYAMMEAWGLLLLWPRISERLPVAVIVGRLAVRKQKLADPS